MLNKYGPKGTLNMSWPEAMAVFTQGKAVFYTDASSLFTNATDPAKSQVADKVGFAPFPAGPEGTKPYNITSWALGIGANSEKKDAAWEFIKWAESKEMVLKLQSGREPRCPYFCLGLIQKAPQNSRKIWLKRLQRTMKLGCTL